MNPPNRDARPAAAPLRRVGPLRAGTLNCSGLGGKVSTIEEFIRREEVDFLFLTETWMLPGSTGRLSPIIVAAFETPREVETGHAPYGLALVCNPSRSKPHHFEVTGVDPERIRKWMAFKYCGILFIGVYLPPCRDEATTQRWLTEIGTVVRAAVGQVVILGDWNARLRRWSDHADNRNGSLVDAWMTQLNLRRVQPSSGQWTFLSHSRRSVIDHVITNEEAFQYVDNGRVWEEEDMAGTEHRVLTFDMSKSLPNYTAAPPRPWNRLRLKDPDVKEALRSYFECTRQQILPVLSCFAATFPPQEAASAMDKVLVEWMETGLKLHVGRSPARKSWAHAFMTQELNHAVQVISHKYKAWQRNQSGSDALPKWRDYLRARSQYRHMFQERREAMFDEFATRIGRMDHSEMLRTVKTIRTGKSRSAPLLRTDRSSMEHYRQFFANQFTNNLPEVPHVSEEEVSGEDEQNMELMLELCSEAAVGAGISKLGKGKAVGESGIPAEVLQIGSMFISGPLCFLFRFCVRHGVVPRSWCRTRIQPVPKKGDLTKISNYRPISLTEIPRKLFESLLLPILVSKIEPLSIEQGGFIRRRGCPDQVAILQQWCLSGSPKSQRFLAFLDIRAAYDSVDRRILWEKCKKKGLGDSLLKVLQALFDYNTSVVAIADNKSEPFPISSGVLQGSLLSPILYSMFIDDIVECVNAVPHSGDLLGGRPFRLLLYADDIVLMSRSERNLRDMLAACEAHADKNRFQFNVGKCVVLSSVPPNQPFCIYGQEIHRAQNFTYLGVVFTAAGIHWEHHFTRMGERANGKVAALKALGCNGNGFSLQTSLRIYKSMIRPILEYGMAMCKPKDLVVPERHQRLAIEAFACVGKKACVDVLGLFDDVLPIKARWERLNANFFLQIRQKNEGFGIHYAFNAYI